MIANNPKRPGQLAAKMKLFGDNDRYGIAPVHSRFAEVSWFVWDTNEIDPKTGGPTIVVQEDTRARAYQAIWARMGKEQAS